MKRKQSYISICLSLYSCSGHFVFLNQDIEQSFPFCKTVLILDDSETSVIPHHMFPPMMIILIITKQCLCLISSSSYLPGSVARIKDDRLDILPTCTLQISDLVCSCVLLLCSFTMIAMIVLYSWHNWFVAAVHFFHSSGP